MMDVVPVAHPIAKKLNGTSPQSTKAGKWRCDGSPRTLVKTKVSTPIMTSGLAIDQPIPRLMFR